MSQINLGFNLEIDLFNHQQEKRSGAKNIITCNQICLSYDRLVVVLGTAVFLGEPFPGLFPFFLPFFPDILRDLPRRPQITLIAEILDGPRGAPDGHGVPRRSGDLIAGVGQGQVDVLAVLELVHVLLGRSEIGHERSDVDAAFAHQVKSAEPKAGSEAMYRDHNVPIVLKHPLELLHDALSGRVDVAGANRTTRAEITDRGR